MARIKKELGSEAIILNTQNTTVDGVPCCEIMAARESNPPQATSGLLPECDPVGFSGWQTMMQEWAELREQCLAVLKPGLHLDQLPSKQRQVVQYLEKEGVSSHCLLRIWKRLRENPDSSPLHILGDFLQTHTWSRYDSGEKIHALAGPYGCGKTSTILRVALAMKRQNPSAEICLANADNYHGKSRLFLKHYADISGLSYRDLQSDRDWKSLLVEQRKYDKVLIDLPGLESRDTMADWIAAECPQVAPRISFHLVLSPLFSSAQQDAFVRRFHVPDMASIIWTKLDEACSYGDLINQSFTSGLPVSLLSFGPGLRNTLATARQTDIWRMIFKHQLPLPDSSKTT